ncbi:hypothetical protein BKA66DRAFT_476813 [Pyrenochaeta sp. MPI-SDFR-AT-0127]|nr:hypothetical protein BKA66DRAFT_476813 [Pyrenochaeta sp. MPI-SDFR-AT-0127]
MAPTRRAHRKSRTGCTECKRRRIKCDEKDPHCSHCIRFDKTCIYPPLRATCTTSSVSKCTPPESDSSSYSVGTGSPSTISIPPVDPSNANLPISLFDLRDLALLHHWSLVTSVSILNTPKLDYFWQTLLSQVAFRHHYVMHSILSLTALHVAYLNPSERRSSLLDAAQHHSKALHGFREDITRICPENCDALFVNASLTFFYAFLTFGKLHDDDSEGSDASGAARTARILGADWIPLVRGVEAVLHPVYDHVRVGPLKSLLNMGNWGELDLETNSDSYDEQIIRVREIWKHGENAEVYNEALDLLRRCRMWIAQFNVLQIEDELEWGYNRGWSGPFVWLLLTPQRYFDLLEQRQPPALVIFAWFGASIHCLNQHWWIEGCGKSIVDMVEECLGPYWTPWTEWPKKIVKPG